MNSTAFTKQMQAWAGDFGREYTDRNSLALRELDALYQGRYGITRSDMNRQFLGGLDRTLRILEVGCNIGNQLLALQEMGFQSLYGIELQWYAVEKAKGRLRGINVIQGSALDVPFKDGYFDLVFTSGLLIHVSPSDIGQVMAEVYRCTRRYVWGIEYWADEYTQVSYRGHDDLLWKADFARLYQNAFADLRLVKEQRYKYTDSENVDAMYLLVKQKS